MRAVVVTPGQERSDRLIEIPDPVPGPDETLVQVVEVGVDGTDNEIVEGGYGEAPPGENFVVIGHESLGRVVRAAGDLEEGQLVVAIVRRPDPLPCLNCEHDEWDMCLNGLYTERGIKGRHGFLSELYAEEPKYVVTLPEDLEPVGVLTEPTSIVEKAIDQITRIQKRLIWRPERAVVTGAGPIGLLAATLLRLRGLDVYVYDRTTAGPKVDLVKTLGVTYVRSDEQALGHEFSDGVGPVDIGIEATGYSPLSFDLLETVGRNGIVVLTGVSAGGRRLELAVDHLNLEMVLENKLLVGTVNANRRHFETAVADLVRIRKGWPGFLEAMITRKEPLSGYRSALQRGPDDVKVVVEMGKDS